MTAAAMAFTNDLRLPFPLAVYKAPSRAASSTSTPPPSPTASGSRDAFPSSINSSRTYVNKPAPSLAIPLSKQDLDSRRPPGPNHSCFDRDQDSVPPPYTRIMEPPSYTFDPPSTSEPRTLPMYMFILGFACPLLWLVGAFMMRTPHSHRRGAFDPYASLSGAEKAAAEREAERRKRRWEVEMKWAKKCMWAAVLFVCVGLAVGISVWGALARGKAGKGALA